jgi:hypothetical protein
MTANTACSRCIKKVAAFEKKGGAEFLLLWACAFETARAQINNGFLLLFELKKKPFLCLPAQRSINTA